jgi:hypothetical protein
LKLNEGKIKYRVVSKSFGLYQKAEAILQENIESEPSAVAGGSNVNRADATDLRADAAAQRADAAGERAN